MAQRVKFQATFESDKGMVMDTVYCLTPGCDFESQVASDCSSRHKAVQDGYDDWHLDD